MVDDITYVIDEDLPSNNLQRIWLAIIVAIGSKRLQHGLCL